MLDEIAVLDLGFQCFHEVTIKEARTLIVFAVQTLIDEVNSNEAIRLYLKNYPFTANNVEIQIWFYHRDGSKVAVNNLELVVNETGTIKYYPRGKDRYKMENPILEETYEKALQIVKRNQ